jgi:DNA-binding NarL/FixJ family response regulator
MIRLAIADDHALIRAGYRQLAAEVPDIRIVGEAADGKGLLELLSATPADVVALDINMPGPGFRELIRRVKAARPGVRVLVVSMYPDGELAVLALRAGASGYVTKGQAATELVAAVRKVHAGGKYVTQALAERLADEIARGDAKSGTEGAVRLSPRERVVLERLATGKSYKEIAAELSVSPKTIGTFRHRLLAKLGLKTTADLIRYQLERSRPAADAAARSEPSGIGSL